MSHRIAFTFVAALATSLVSLAGAANATETTQDQGGGMHGFLSPQQRAMLMMESRDQWRSMSDDQRHAARDKMRSEWMAMTPEQRDAKRAALQAKWEALPQDQKDAMNARIQQWAQHRSHDQH